VFVAAGEGDVHLYERKNRIEIGGPKTLGWTKTLYASDFCEIFFFLDLSNEMIVLESLHYSRRYAVMSETLNPKIWILGFTGGVYLLSL
jgi:hypothetical protein